MLELHESYADTKVSLLQVTVSLDDTIILHGGGDKKQIEERCEQVQWFLLEKPAYLLSYFSLYVLIFYFYQVVLHIIC